MKPLGFRLLADQNVQLAVVVALRERGADVRTVDEEGLATATDARIARSVALLENTLGGRSPWGFGSHARSKNLPAGGSSLAAVVG